MTCCWVCKTWRNRLANAGGVAGLCREAVDGEADGAGDGANRQSCWHRQRGGGVAGLCGKVVNRGADGAGDRANRQTNWQR